MRKDRVSVCPSCGGKKDSRAKQCRHCRMTLNPMRLGTGKGWYEHSSGYIIGCFGNGNEYQHIHVMEEFLGRKLETDECVHHWDEIKSNNEIKNLELMLKVEHARYHSTKRDMKAMSAKGHEGRWGYVPGL